MKAPEFMDYIKDQTYRLFRVYEINGKIVLIEEQYGP
jgi:hypothetical protein